VPEDKFPSFSDLDMSIVVEGERSSWPEEAYHQGLMLEFGIEAANDDRSLETIVSHPSRAPNLLGNSILADPYGVLSEA
jgi:hypothetical protein